MNVYCWFWCGSGSAKLFMFLLEITFFFHFLNAHLCYVHNGFSKLPFLIYIVVLLFFLMIFLLSCIWYWRFLSLSASLSHLSVLVWFSGIWLDTLVVCIAVTRNGLSGLLKAFTPIILLELPKNMDYLDVCSIIVWWMIFYLVNISPCGLGAFNNL